MKDNKRLNDVIDNNNTDGCEGCPGPDEADCKVGKICLKVAGAGCPDVSNCLACPAHDNLKATCSKAVDHSFTGLALCALPVMAIFPGQWKDLATPKLGTIDKIPPPAEYICWDLCGLRAMHVVDVPMIDLVLDHEKAHHKAHVAFDGILDDCEDCDSWEECRDGYCDACKML